MEEKQPRLHTLVLAAQRIGSMQIPVYAANACYFFVLSIFPILLIVLSLVPYLPYSARDLLELLEQVVPSALMGMVETVIVHIYYSSSHAVLGLSAVVSVWSSSKAIYGILTGLNHIYGVREDRSILYTRLLSFGYTFVFLGLLVLTLVLQVFGPVVMSWLDLGDSLLVGLLGQIIDLRAVVMLTIQIVIFTAIYMVLPNRRNRFFDSLPGAAVAAVGWQVFSWAFSFYVENLGNQVSLYGSVYAIALGMLWLYCCMSILLFGGGVNRLIQQWRRK
ncbi:MAG: YihY/virulence factor BrkB family protein [Oscillospiraceae bacterium]|nr:YihY/virulence factor BrkB family protein [Oscillospiraceae bacterium]